MNIATLKGITIPEGVVTELSINGQSVWTQAVADPQEQYWVPFDANKTLWMGETVLNNGTGPEDYVGATQFELSGSLYYYQYRITVDGVQYLVEPGDYPHSEALIWDGGQIEHFTKGYFKVTFNDASSHTLKVESWIGTEPYVAS